MTRTDLRSRIRKRLGETTAAFWTDSEINAYINTACKDIAWRTKCLRATGLLTSISCVENEVAAASNEYLLGDSFSNILAILEVYFKQNGEGLVRLEPTTREELDALNPSWQSLLGYTKVIPVDETTNETFYNYGSNPAIPQSYYWSKEENVLGLFPPPNEENSGIEYIKVYYAFDHSDIVTDAEEPILPVNLHQAVVDFCVYQGLEDRGWGDRANDVLSKYLSKLNDYGVEKKREREDDELIMKSIYNLR